MLAAAATTEVLMAANRYEEINFARVSSLCLQHVSSPAQQAPSVPPTQDNSQQQHARQAKESSFMAFSSSLSILRG